MLMALWQCTKTRLVAKGFIQVEAIDFNETFSLIARMESI
jgi:hypothetical protein